MTLPCRTSFRSIALLVAVSLAFASPLTACSGDDDADATSVQSLPFPADTDRYAIGNVIEIDEEYSDYGWAGRRSGDDSNTTLMFQPAGYNEADSTSNPVFVSFPPAEFYEEYESWEEQIANQRPLTENGDLSYFLANSPQTGVPQDLPAAVFFGEHGMFTVAQRDASEDDLVATADQLAVDEDGQVSLSDDATAELVGRLGPKWTTGSNASIVGLWDETDMAANTVVVVRGISELEANVLVGLANRDPEESLRSEASISGEETFEKPVTQTISGSTATIATLATGIRAVINPDVGYALFNAGNGISTQFLPIEELADLASGIEMVDRNEFLDRQGAAQLRNRDRALEVQKNQFEGYEDIAPTVTELWTTTLNDGTNLRLTKYSASSGEVSESFVEDYLEVFDPSTHFFTPSPIPLENERPTGAKAGVDGTETERLIVGVMPEGTERVDGTMDDATASVETFATGVAEYPAIFIMPLESDGFRMNRHFTVIGYDSEGTEIARIEPTKS